jgi:hypothetical protein
MELTLRYVFLCKLTLTLESDTIMFVLLIYSPLPKKCHGNVMVMKCDFSHVLIEQSFFFEANSALFA